MPSVRFAVIALALLFAAPATDDDVAARLFASGLTFGQFLERAKAQRAVWLRNAARTDVRSESVERLKRVRAGLQVLVVAEDWCADSVHTVPYLANLAAAAGVELRVVLRGAGAPIMSAHRTQDGRLVTPVVVLLRNNRDVAAWVERPAPLQQLFFAIAADATSARAFARRADWYETDRGRTTLAEFLSLAEATGPK